ncbi:hypothetical protein [Kitasatospora griseola]|uniref:hypothetical protein n=1 Tax=Kitasatospora griseola TaxID=2064 RepID=UPI000B1E3289|nr:hypothetical protein [Kitasatospora griseola]
MTASQVDQAQLAAHRADDRGPLRGARPGLAPGLADLAVLAATLTAGHGTLFRLG